mmetsp:Transcript_8992/g.12783  ORF Transcript_8992/g.12783 Transcript_8992/m.12783 type:complete len:559 (+) Transcript_8992:42-1718(+)
MKLSENAQEPKEGVDINSNIRTTSAGLPPLETTSGMSSTTNTQQEQQPVSPLRNTGTSGTGRRALPRISMESTGTLTRRSATPFGATSASYKIIPKLRRLERRERSIRITSGGSIDPDLGQRTATYPPPSGGGRTLSMIPSARYVEDAMPTKPTSPEASEVTPLVFGKDGTGQLTMPDMGELPLDGMTIDSGSPPKMTTGEALWDVFFGKPILSLFLIFIPFAVASHHLQWSPQSIFWLNFLAMIPLASILGDFTEEVAAHTNQVIGGLVNATFGNVVELLVAIQALLKDEIRVVQASMLGSIFSNLLLVLGSCFFFGGIRHKEQTFNATAATANMSLLALSSIALVLPTPFAEYYDLQDEHVLQISRLAAVFLVIMYIQLLIFQLKTHTDIFEDEDDEEPVMSMTVALVGLCVVTLMLAFLSDYLVDSIDGYVESSGVSRTFVGLIILPLVGNAVEHMTAVSVAMKNKMDLAMGVAVGSCTQISLFVVPFTVIFGWIFDKRMTLNFPHFEIMLYVLSVFTVSICLSNPSGNWLEGSLLITTYLMIALGFWYEDLQDF